MQVKRKKRSRIRAAKHTAGHGHKKKNRGAGHRGGRGKAGGGKRNSQKIMKLTKGVNTLGKFGFKSIAQKKKTINLGDLNLKLYNWLKQGIVKKNKDTYEIDLSDRGYDKLLSKGRVKLTMNIIIKEASPNAVKKVEAAGGTVKTLDEGTAK